MVLDLSLVYDTVPTLVPGYRRRVNKSTRERGALDRFLLLLFVAKDLLEDGLHGELPHVGVGPDLLGVPI